mgnify:FL=1
MIWVRYTLHSFAFVAQIAGGVLVVNEAVRTLWNVQLLRSDLADAETIKDQHRAALKQDPGSIPGFGGGRINLPRIASQAHEGLVQQLGPGAAAERTALRQFLEAQFSADGRRTWAGVALLVVGIVVGYFANMLGVAAS